MFKGIVNWFKGEQKPGYITNGETDMTARIEKIEQPGFTDQFGLFTRNGLVQTYSRRRDAVRGATRRGLTVA